MTTGGLVGRDPIPGRSPPPIGSTCLELVPLSHVLDPLYPNDCPSDSSRSDAPPSNGGVPPGNSPGRSNGQAKRSTSQPAVTKNNPAETARNGSRDHGQRRQAIVQSVLAEVFQGKLRPGQHLVTQRLAEQFGVSHTPVREAMITLAGIGIVDLVPNRGAVVRSVSEKDVQEICQVRKVLECEAVRLSCGQIPLAALHEISDALKQLDEMSQRPAPGFIQEARRVDSYLHDLIAESSGNRFLTQELNRLKLLFRAFRDVAWEHDEARDDYHRLTEEGHEHAAIVQALLAQDARAAARAMSRHIRSGLKYWSRALPMTRYA